MYEANKLLTTSLVTQEQFYLSWGVKACIDSNAIISYTDE